MSYPCPGTPWPFVALAAGLWWEGQTNGMAQAGGSASTGPTHVVLLELENSVEVRRAGARVWDAGTTNQVLYPGDQVKTGERSRAVLRLSNLTLMRVGELSYLEIPEPEPAGRVGLNIFKGIYYFFHRDKPGDLQIRTPAISAVVRGTEFNLEVAESGKTVLSLVEGGLRATNEFVSIDLRDGESIEAAGGASVARTAVLDATRAIQWCLYYPAVLDLAEIPLRAEEERAFKDSLAAYRRGNLPRALALYPPDRKPVSPAEKIYRAALLLSVGQVAEAEGLLDSAQSGDAADPEQAAVAPLGPALRKMIAATRFQDSPPASHLNLATEWLAESYARQSRSDLKGALAAARAAAEKSPGFGFARARVAELEFSFGRTAEASRALGDSLESMPENAQARALQGYLDAARNRLDDALRAFDAAIALDGALGNGWFGRGLCRIQRGDVAGGLEDLQTAATLEPQRSMLRSYLAKAYSESWDDARAAREIARAKRLDPADPTPWLYSALIAEQENRINPGVRDLETSRSLNGNRSLYRSRFLLDQDLAVRSANLAALYRDAGMPDVSRHEASQAVAADYANSSAHLFLANSDDALRDPRLIDLRWETAAVSEYLLANLLSPPGAGVLSRTISQQEYSRLFERDRPHVSVSAEYLSGGDWVQNGAVFGKTGNLGYALESSYRSENGQRQNDDLDQLNLSLSLKQQLTAQDAVYIQAVDFRSESGDLAQYYDPADANPRLRVKEEQQPLLLAGYHREWTPTLHTLVLASRLADRFDVRNPTQPVLLLGRDASNHVVLIAKPSLPAAALEYSSDVEIYSGEIQQIWQGESQGAILGVRYQAGRFDTQSRLGDSSATLVGDESMTVPVPVSTPALDQDVSTDFERLSVYGYHQWRPFEPLVLTAGLAYDRLLFPANFRQAPLADGSLRNDKVSPKAGILWTPTETTTFRGSYTRSLGGAGIDQSFRLEPSEVGGFNQAFRSLIPESVAGSVANASFETAGVGADQRFPSGTYLGLEGAVLSSRASQRVGAFDLATTFPFAITPSATRQDLDFRERSVSAYIHQLLGNDWSVGARYRLSEAKLHDRFPEIPAAVSLGADVTEKATLQQLDVFVLFHHPSGFFGGADGLWTAQQNRGYSPALPGDSFWHVNAFTGYRFARRRAEVVLGLLNIGDQDYRINPLNQTRDARRHRTLTVSMKLSF